MRTGQPMSMNPSQPTAHLVRAVGIVGLLILAACTAGTVADADGEGTDETSASQASLLAGEVTLFSSTDLPATASDSDGAAVEVGTKFTSDVDGTVTGIRYYRGAANTGAHTAHLWSAEGALLASATFRTTRATGWQTVRFAAPVAVVGGRTYVASYHTDVGHYAATNDYFAGRSKDSAPLHAPADRAESHNGVYHYGASAFPTDSYRASNYWVDVLLKPAGVAPPPPATDAGTTPVPPAIDAGTPPPPPATDAGTTPPPVIDAGTTPPPASGAFPGPSNTGVPAGTVLTPSGSLNITTPGTVIDALEVNGCITVSASNVTIKRTLVHGGGCYEPIHVASGTNLQVFDTEIDGERSAMCGESIGPENYTITRVNAHSCSDGPRLAGTGPITIQDSWIHDLSNLPNDHGDGIQSYGHTGGTVVVRHNTIAGGSNAAFFTADGSSGDMIIDSNLMSGGGFTLRVYDNRVRVTNNLIVAGSYQFGPVHAFSAPGASDPGVTIVEWTNNHLCANADGTGVGALIAQP